MTPSYPRTGIHFTASDHKEYLFGLILHQGGASRTFRGVRVTICTRALGSWIAQLDAVL
jgi:hypothetical protein